MSSAALNTIDQSIADRRILRLAFGTALSMFISQAIDWPISFIAPIFTAFVLTLPLPAPTIKGSLVFIAILIGSILFSYIFLPFIYHAPLAGILLLALGLFYSFFITSSGGPALVGTFLVLALTLVTTIGSSNIDALMEVTIGLAKGSFGGFVCVWIACAVFPDIKIPPLKDGKQPEQKSLQPKPDRRTAFKSAIRSMAIVYPVMILLLFIDDSSGYTIIMIKVASMGQQVSGEQSRTMGKTLIDSTIWGGLGAAIAWALLKACPILPLYTLLIALAALVYGKGIFQGRGSHPKATMVQYAFVTMIVVLAPSVGSMASGDSSSDRFWVRLLYFFIIALYGWCAVNVFDAFWGENRKNVSVSG